MERIKKTVITVTVLHPAGDRPESMSLEELGRYIVDGDGVGSSKTKSVEDVPARRVQSELVAVGNDGSFFGECDAGEDKEVLPPCFTVTVNGLAFERIIELAVEAPNAAAAERAAQTYINLGRADGVMEVSERDVEYDDNTIECEVEPNAAPGEG